MANPDKIFANCLCQKMTVRRIVDAMNANHPLYELATSLAEIGDLPLNPSYNPKAPKTLGLSPTIESNSDELDFSRWDAVFQSAISAIENYKYKSSDVEWCISIYSNNTYNYDHNTLWNCVFSTFILVSSNNIFNLDGLDFVTNRTRQDNEIEAAINILRQRFHDWKSGEKSTVNVNDALSTLLGSPVETIHNDEIVGFLKSISKGVSGTSKLALGKWAAAATDQYLKVTLPDQAPAIWKEDRRPGETPPDFVTRHYGPDGLDVLRADGTGLVRADLGPGKEKLDPSLYRAVTSWLSKPGHQWPSDCPLPTRSEAVVAALPEKENIISNQYFREANRLRMARWRLEKRQERDPNSSADEKT